MGVIKDLPAQTLPLEAWSNALNVHFHDGFIERMDGAEEVFNLTVSAATATQQLAVAPWFACPVPTTDGHFWLYGDGNSIYAHNGTTDANVTRWSTATESFVLYSATAPTRWNYANIGGLPYLTNGMDYPQVWASPSLTSKLRTAQWDASSGSTWAAFTRSGTVIAATCLNLRRYREFLVALDMTENDVRYPRRVRWSHPVIEGNQPTTWDDTRTDKLARYIDLDGTEGFVLDSASIGDMHLIYKEDSIWRMQYANNTRYVHQITPAIPDIGLFARGCLGVFQPQGTLPLHVFITSTEDVVTTNGSGVNSIIDGRNRKALFNAINPTYLSNTFLTIDQRNTEVLIFIPTMNTDTPYFCDRAFVWNWRTDTWTERDIGAVNAGYGRIQFGGGSTQLLKTWVEFESTPWSDLLTTAWGDRAYSPINTGLLLCKPVGATGQLLKYNSGDTYAGTVFPAYIEREGCVVVGLDSHGRPIYDPVNVKRINRIWVHAIGPVGAVIKVYLGSRMLLSQAISYDTSLEFTLGTNETQPTRVVGRDLAIRCDIPKGVKLSGFTFDIDVVGRY